MTTLICPTCGPTFDGAYNTDHRCITCGTMVIADHAETELAKLRRKNRELREALELILEESEDLTRYEIDLARYAMGDE